MAQKQDYKVDVETGGTGMMDSDLGRVHGGDVVQVDPEVAERKPWLTKEKGSKKKKTTKKAKGKADTEARADAADDDSQEE